MHYSRLKNQDNSSSKVQQNLPPSSSSADPGVRASQDLSSGYSHRLIDQSVYTRGGYVPPPKPSVTPIK